MNLTTYHIEDIHSVKPYSADWTTGFPSKVFLKVILTVRSGGLTQKLHRIWNVGDWEGIKERGFFTE